jgi:hypothetical protein
MTKDASHAQHYQIQTPDTSTPAEPLYADDVTGLVKETSISENAEIYENMAIDGHDVRYRFPGSPAHQSDVSTQDDAHYACDDPDFRPRYAYWVEAYERLEREDPRLVDAYERILSSHLQNSDESRVVAGPCENKMKSMSSEERQLFLKGS